MEESISTEAWSVHTAAERAQIQITKCPSVEHTKRVKEQVGLDLVMCISLYKS